MTSILDCKYVKHNEWSLLLFFFLTQRLLILFQLRYLLLFIDYFLIIPHVPNLEKGVR